MSNKIDVIFDDEAEIDAKGVATELLSKMREKGLSDKQLKVSRIAPTFGISTATVANLLKKGYKHTDGSQRTFTVEKVEGRGSMVSLVAICEYFLNRGTSKRGGAGRVASSVMIRFAKPEQLQIIRDFAAANGFTVLTAKELAAMRAEKAAAKAAKQAEANSAAVPA